MGRFYFIATIQELIYIKKQINVTQKLNFKLIQNRNHQIYLYVLKSKFCYIEVSYPLKLNCFEKT